MYRVVSGSASKAVRSQAHAGSGVSSKAALHKAASLVENAYTSLFERMGLLPHAGAHGMQHRRSYVSGTTHEALKNIIPERIDTAPLPPYQAYGECETLAHDLMNLYVDSARKKKGKAQVDTPERQPGLGAMWDKLKSALQSKFESWPVRTADDYLKLYQGRGVFSLRAAGLSNAYVDHTVTVFSVTKINTSQGEKIVLGVLDCNDIEDNPETNAAWEAARRRGKGHVSELSHEEANQCGADQRRIRFIDGDSLAKRTVKAYENFRRSGVDMPYPQATCPKEGIPCLTPGQERELRKLLEKIYDAEVETFE